MHGSDALQAACPERRAPALNHAHQADDGSLKTIKILNTQVSELASQKGHLLTRVSDLQQDQCLLEKRLEHALNEVAEQRRQRVDMMTHRVRRGRV